LNATAIREDDDNNDEDGGDGALSSGDEFFRSSSSDSIDDGVAKEETRTQMDGLHASQLLAETDTMPSSGVNNNSDTVRNGQHAETGTMPSSGLNNSDTVRNKQREETRGMPQQADVNGSTLAGARSSVVRRVLGVSEDGFEEFGWESVEELSVSDETSGASPTSALAH
jgi:hypothetical protein